MRHTLKRHRIALSDDFGQMFSLQAVKSVPLENDDDFRTQGTHPQKTNEHHDLLPHWREANNRCRQIKRNRTDKELYTVSEVIVKKNPINSSLYKITATILQAKPERTITPRITYENVSV